MGIVKLVYKGIASFSKEDAKMIIIRATKPLKDVFENEDNNISLLQTFTSSETFLERETKKVRKVVDDPVVFAEKFCELLKQRDDDAIVGALNLLLNLADDDQDLVIYEKKVRKLFKELLPGDLVVQDVIESQLNQNVENNTKPVAVIIPQGASKDDKEPAVQWQLTYKGSEVNNNNVAKQILTRATVELLKVFKHKSTNAVVLGIFKGQGVLQDLETECLEELNITSTDWAITFLKLLGQRFDPCRALQLLCNLNEVQLENYQLQIHAAFETGLNYPDVKVVMLQN